MLQHVARDVRQIEPLLREPLDDRRGTPAASPATSAEASSWRIFAVGHAEHARHVVPRELDAAEGDDLIEEAHRVAHRAGRLAGEDLHGGASALMLSCASTCSSRRAIVCVGMSLKS